MNAAQAYLNSCLNMPTTLSKVTQILAKYNLGCYEKALFDEGTTPGERSSDLTLAIIALYNNGVRLQAKMRNDMTWVDIPASTHAGMRPNSDYLYRIHQDGKPKTHRAYKTVDEVPLGKVVTGKGTPGKYRWAMVAAMPSTGSINVTLGTCAITAHDLVANYQFEDGTPCGIAE